MAQRCKIDKATKWPPFFNFNLVFNGYFHNTKLKQWLDRKFVSVLEIQVSVFFFKDTIIFIPIKFNENWSISFGPQGWKFVAHAEKKCLLHCVFYN